MLRQNTQVALSIPPTTPDVGVLAIKFWSPLIVPVVAFCYRSPVYKLHLTVTSEIRLYHCEFNFSAFLRAHPVL